MSHQREVSSPRCNRFVPGLLKCSTAGSLAWCTNTGHLPITKEVWCEKFLYVEVFETNSHAEVGVHIWPRKNTKKRFHKQQEVNDEKSISSAETAAHMVVDLAECEDGKKNDPVSCRTEGTGSSSPGVRDGYLLLSFLLLQRADFQRLSRFDLKEQKTEDD